jgi:hypothetical protein
MALTLGRCGSQATSKNPQFPLMLATMTHAFRVRETAAQANVSPALFPPD